MLARSFLAIVMANSALYGLAAVTNQTIDDNFGDSSTGLVPLYTPRAGWIYGPDCLLCFVAPNSAYAYQGSWHQATDGSEGTSTFAVSLLFNGSALYVFNMVPAFTTALADTNTNLQFTMDGQDAGAYVATPTASGWDNFQYNVPVYVNESLGHGLHTFTMSPTAGTTVFFDYAVYTTKDDVDPTTSLSVSGPAHTTTTTTSSTSSASSHSAVAVGTVAGAAVGGTTAFALFIVGILFCCWRRRRRARDQIPAHDDMVETRNKPTADWTLVPEPFLLYSPTEDIHGRPVLPDRRFSDAPTYTSYSAAPLSDHRHPAYTPVVAEKPPYLGHGEVVVYRSSSEGWPNHPDHWQRGSFATPAHGWMQYNEEEKSPASVGRRSSEYGYGVSRNYIPTSPTRVRRPSTATRHGAVLEVRNPDSTYHSDAQNGSCDHSDCTLGPGCRLLTPPPPPAYLGDQDDRESSCPGTTGHSEKGGS